MHFVRILRRPVNSSFGRRLETHVPPALDMPVSLGRQGEGRLDEQVAFSSGERGEGGAVGVGYGRDNRQA